MATFNKGILGGFPGKTGSVTGSNWKGRTVMRRLPGKRSKAPTQTQLDQQEKFKLAVSFLSGMSELFNITFKAFVRRWSWGNLGLSGWGKI